MPDVKTIQLNFIDCFVEIVVKATSHATEGGMHEVQLQMSLQRTEEINFR